MKSKIIISILSVFMLISCTSAEIASKYYGTPPKDKIEKILVVINNKEILEEFYDYFSIELGERLRKQNIKGHFYKFNELTISPEDDIKEAVKTYQPDGIMFINTYEVVLGNYGEVIQIIMKISITSPNEEEAFWKSSLFTKGMSSAVPAEKLVQQLVKDKVINGIN